MVAGQPGSSGFLHQLCQAEEQSKGCWTGCFPRLHAHFQGGGGKWCFMFKNMPVPKAPCDSFSAFSSKAVSLAPGCFQPHSLFWDLSFLRPWLQQRLYWIFISQVSFCFNLPFSLTCSASLFPSLLTPLHSFSRSPGVAVEDKKGRQELTQRKKTSSDRRTDTLLLVGKHAASATSSVAKVAPRTFALLKNWFGFF